ncbi:MAG: cupredoxin domain-containing protein [Chloroflexi bacterium]|nr:cupredoxin domain-containing protein [Chloroflexota bacterium]
MGLRGWFERFLGPAMRPATALVLASTLVALLPSGASAADVQVVVVQPTDQLAWRYDPANLTVTTGTTVTWVNQGTAPITVTSPDGLFDSEQILPNASFSATFYAPGTYRYFCVPYPHMKGTILVTP